MSQEKTPGVYLQEVSAFPNSIVEVATAVPVFIGYTEKAEDASKSLSGIPTRLTSLLEFRRYFGTGPGQRFSFDLSSTGKTQITPTQTTRFNLYNSMRLFFDNGGGPCWIVSVGSYDDVKKPNAFGDKVWETLTALPEITLVVMPDAVLMPTAKDFKAIWDRAFAHCRDMRNRMAILDVYNGDQARSHDAADVISGDQGFRRLLSTAALQFGVAYYPWLNTNLYAIADVSYQNLDEASKTKLADHVTAEFAGETLPQEHKDTIAALVTALQGVDQSDTLSRKTHDALSKASKRYKETMAHILQAVNLLPPSAAMAGIYARIDSNHGVFKPPANCSVFSVTSPSVVTTHDDQEDLNTPLDGMAVNAIRSFTGRGVLVWGARTLDGNSQDWRYVNVRRTLIMLERSIAMAVQAYVFEPNDASTWAAVRTMIENFLTNQWKVGALAG
ncbi:MAG: phage tail sheath C-terminal domain-containing protein, partial [Pseudomonadota bacterium]